MPRRPEVIRIDDPSGRSAALSALLSARKKPFAVSLVPLGSAGSRLTAAGDLGSDNNSFLNAGTLFPQVVFAPESILTCSSDPTFLFDHVIHLLVDHQRGNDQTNGGRELETPQGASGGCIPCYPAHLALYYHQQV